MANEPTAEERRDAEKFYNKISEGKTLWPTPGWHIDLIALYARSCEREAVEKCCKIIRDAPTVSKALLDVHVEFHDLLSEEK